MFLPTKNVKKEIQSQKMSNVLKRIFEVFARFVVFEIWSIIYSTFIVNWSGNLIQKYKAENQLARGDSIQKHPGPGGGTPVGVRKA